MAAVETVIVGIDKDLKDTSNVRLIMYNYDKSNNRWQFNKTMVTLKQLIGAIKSSKIIVKNADIKEENGKIKFQGTYGAIQRFNSNQSIQPLVIISEILMGK